MIDNAKSNDCIIWIQPWQNVRQQSMNDSCSCILGNMWGDRLQIVINKELATFIAKRESNTLPAPSWEWTWTECERFFVMYLE
jgi:hypothetical protein